MMLFFKNDGAFIRGKTVIVLGRMPGTSDILRYWYFRGDGYSHFSNADERYVQTLAFGGTLVDMRVK